MALDTNRPKNYKRAWNGGRNLVKQPLTCEEWNAEYPVGTPVMVVKDSGAMVSGKTRSEAFVCNAGYAVIFVTGIRGYYLLDRVAPTGAKPDCAECGGAGISMQPGMPDGEPQGLPCKTCSPASGGADGG
jgi:hypothetical protein